VIKMAVFSKKIVGYMAGLMPVNDGSAGASIEIYCEDSYSLLLWFLEGEPLPYWAINDYDEANFAGEAFVPGISQYQYYIDLLRNEGPLSIQFDTGCTPPYFQIYTSEPEGIGEGEIADTLDRITALLARKPLADKP
jgi:hypothetical protein